MNGCCIWQKCSCHLWIILTHDTCGIWNFQDFHTCIFFNILVIMLSLGFISENLDFEMWEVFFPSETPGAFVDLLDVASWPFRWISLLLRWEVQFSSVQSLSCVQLFVTPWTAARQASLSLTISQSLPKFISIELVKPSHDLILCCPFLLLPSIFPTIRVFSNESAVHIRWPMYWNFSFSFSPFKEYSVLIYFKIDWFDLLAVQGTLKSLH